VKCVVGKTRGATTRMIAWLGGVGWREMAARCRRDIVRFAAMSGETRWMNEEQVDGELENGVMRMSCFEYEPFRESRRIEWMV
jgi:hypothetical protein